MNPKLNELIKMVNHDENHFNYLINKTRLDNINFNYRQKQYYDSLTQIKSSEIKNPISPNIQCPFCFSYNISKEEENSDLGVDFNPAHKIICFSCKELYFVGSRLDC